MSDDTGRPHEDHAVAREARAASSRGPNRMATAGMPAEKPKDLTGGAKRLVAMLGPERRHGVLALALAVASVALTVIGPRLLGRATDMIVDGLAPDRSIDLDALHRLLIGVIGLYALASLLAYLQGYVLAGMVQRAMHRLRGDVADKINRVPLRYVDGQSRGDLLSRVSNDIDNVAQSLQQTLSQLLVSALTILGVLGMMLAISPVLALVAVVSIPAALVAVAGIARRAKAQFVRQWAHTGSLNSHVEETVTGHTLVKVFGRQRDFEERFNRTNDELLDASFRAQFISGTIQPAMMFLSNLGFVAVAVIGGVRVVSGALSLGDVQAFIQYSRQFTQPLTQVASMVNVLQSGIASAERVFELLDAPEEAPDAVAPPPGGPRAGRVEFDDVSFSYEAGTPLISGLTFVAEPGQTVAIVGPTGAGKTTLVNLLMRFYELDGGVIRLDGQDIATMARRDLRGRIGMVLQDTWLFGGTIRDNIAYGDLTASEDEIRSAARASYVDRFVHSLPHGYDTVIDDGAGNLSAGELQLVTIARAFLANPSMLVLDEATSSVDTRTEVLIQHAMAALRSDRTSFVIAHRLSTIRDADTILVMEAGDIVEQGSHDQLLARRGAYHRLYNAQFDAPALDPDPVP